MTKDKTYPQVSVAAIVINADNLFFLAKRGLQARNERGYWEFPGGRVEFGEKLIDAVQREFMEEYAMQIEVTKLFGVYEHFVEGEHWVSATYLAKHIGANPQIMEPPKCEAIGWFALDNLPEPLAYLTQQEIRDYQTPNSYGV